MTCSCIHVHEGCIVSLETVNCGPREARLDSGVRSIDGGHENTRIPYRQPPTCCSKLRYLLHVQFVRLTETILINIPGVY